MKTQPGEDLFVLRAAAALWLLDHDEDPNAFSLRVLVRKALCNTQDDEPASSDAASPPSSSGKVAYDAQLVDALEAAIKWMFAPGSAGAWMNDESTAAYNVAISKVEAALAKARGEEVSNA